MPGSVFKELKAERTNLRYLVHYTKCKFYFDSVVLSKSKNFDMRD